MYLQHPKGKVLKKEGVTSFVGFCQRAQEVGLMMDQQVQPHGVWQWLGQEWSRRPRRQSTEWAGTEAALEHL